jgi:Gnt-I system low-affinity gluconate transporter
MELQLLLAIVFGIIVLLDLILSYKVQAFLALLISCVLVGILAGMPPSEIVASIQKGMGNTLGFVAVVVGLGAMFGAILEASGGAHAIAGRLLNENDSKRTSWALMATGFLIAIPVFFDVGFIILVPLVYSLQRSTGKSLLLYGIPLLAGLAITHAFIPPTPGPVAVADILKVDLGWVIVAGVLVGLPTAVVAGPLFGNYIGRRIMVQAPKEISEPGERKVNAPVGQVISIIALPILLIVINTLFGPGGLWSGLLPADLSKWLELIGHPFAALILANLIAWYVLGLKRGMDPGDLLQITGRSLAPAGVIILLTGAGGAFKQILTDTGVGALIAEYFTSLGMGALVFGFVVALLVRVLQGSATVAMITAAGMTAPFMSEGLSDWKQALVVVAIASGASMLSHVNDSGFWLVNKYLGLSELQTFRSWTVMTLLLGLTGFSCALLLSLLS